MKQSVIVLTLIASVSTFAAVDINFEEPGAQPTIFIFTNALRDELASEGARFATIGGVNDGPAILNQGGNFGFGAKSGTQFLAYNNRPLFNYVSGGLPFSGVRINFSSTWSKVSIWTNSSQPGTTTMRAYNSENLLLSSDSWSGVNSWKLLTVSGTSISHVVLDAPDRNFGAYDDLTAVPEPTSLATLIVALVILARTRKASD